MEGYFLPDPTQNLISSFHLLGNAFYVIATKQAAQYFVLILETSCSGWGRRTLRCHMAVSTKDQQFRWNLGSQSMPIQTGTFFFSFLFCLRPSVSFVGISPVKSPYHTEANRNPLLTVTPMGACWHTLPSSRSPNNGFRLRPHRKQSVKKLISASAPLSRCNHTNTPSKKSHKKQLKWSSIKQTRKN